MRRRIHHSNCSTVNQRALGLFLSAVFCLGWAEIALHCCCFLCVTVLGAEYEFRLSAENNIGTGSEVEARISLPTRVSWKPPKAKFQNGHIMAYDVRIYQVDQEDATEKIYTVTDKAQFSFLALKPGTYHCFIRARNSAGAGMWTDRVEIPIPAQARELHLVGGIPASSCYSDSEEFHPMPEKSLAKCVKDLRPCPL
ncbi:hypothetical protein Ciccas_014186 [Cichlidogyrus casuarinus]|uniref:Fibronectin type-III domain-containing protein n=1 Tax=Cichlidogyrus casuarinus TaxID=1844966 RepID=A0ABD2PIU2_9PLAT